MPATMNVHRLATYRDRLQAGSPVQPELQAFRLASDSPYEGCLMNGDDGCVIL
ncbi:hypothetical protein Bca52824_082304 [Brassica carinata]|uniref:Uncharacterized protein n=1 Tax=Brassica carinata TaxID=52824 RepID=A0A8X7PK18_BRACI|nr:hypothetical protein Bca52824_082304 [Brassica carinata]